MSDSLEKFMKDDLPFQVGRGRPEKLYTCNGESHTLTEWSDILGVKRKTLVGRLRRKIPAEQALQKDFVGKKRGVHEGDKVWKGELLDVLFELCDSGFTLKEMGDWFGITRERVRQVLSAHGKKTIRRPADCLPMTVVCKNLKMGSSMFHELVEEGETIQKNGKIFVNKNLIPVIKRRREELRTKKCVTCGKVFAIENLRNNRKIYCNSDCRPPSGVAMAKPDIFELWHQELVDRLPGVDPDVQGWGTVNEVIADTSLTTIMVYLLEAKGIISTEVCSYRTWNHMPVKLFSYSEIALADEIRKKYKRKNRNANH